MKWLHKLIVTSETYRRASMSLSASSSEASGASLDDRFATNQKLDPANHTLWRFPVQRLEAEPIRDAMLFLAGDLDLSLGGRSFDGSKSHSHRRTAYMSRGYKSSAELMPDFLTAFDVEDGRAVCPRRNQTVTAPQALFMMNNQLVDEISSAYAKRLSELSRTEANSASAESGEHQTAPWADLINLGFRTALSRPATEKELAQTQAYLGNNSARVQGLAWLLLNLDEFIYLR